MSKLDNTVLDGEINIEKLSLVYQNQNWIILYLMGEVNIEGFDLK